MKGGANRKIAFGLIPGSGGSAWYWHRVTPLLEHHGHRAVAVELPAADDDAGLPEYASAVVDAIGKHDGARVVLVAQSMAGFTAPLVCGDVRVAMIVLVNAMIPNPGETVGAWWGNTGFAAAKRENDVRAGRNPDAPFDALREFFHDVPQAIIDEAWRQGEPRQSDTIFASACAMKSWPRVPTRILIGRDDRFFPAEFQKRVAMERLGIEPDEMPGGHLVALSQPEELTRRLIAYATKAGNDR